jgi:hypothetical protein
MARRPNGQIREGSRQSVIGEPDRYRRPQKTLAPAAYASEPTGYWLKERATECYR